MNLQVWKLPHIGKGILTWIPPIDAWRRRHISTGGTNNARYCYSVWLRHLVSLNCCGFRIKGASVGELGPGDSIGTGLAALLSGAGAYIGLDLLPFSVHVNIKSIFKELVQLYRSKEPVPDEFPRIRPRLDSYKFPDDLIDWPRFNERVELIEAEVAEITETLGCGKKIRYRAPWHSLDDVESNSLDLLWSQAVLEYVMPLSDIYRCMSFWLKTGGYASHVIDFSAHYLSPYWNGHWAYCDFEWRLAQGKREAFLNREPHSKHIGSAQDFGFDVVSSTRDLANNGLSATHLAPRFRNLDPEDLRTRGAHLVLRKSRS